MKYFKSFVVLCCLAQLLLIGGSGRLLARGAAAEGLGLSADQAKKLNNMIRYNLKHAEDQVASEKIPMETTVSKADQLKVLKYINKNVEVHTSFNPVNYINFTDENWNKWTSASDLMAASGELKNIHQVHRSDIGGAGDSPVRALTEIASFYPMIEFWPERMSYWDGIECTHDCSKAEQYEKTLLTNFKMERDVKLLPKYGALNYLARWDGLLKDFPGVDTTPITFVYKQQVKVRMTITAKDSLRSWCYKPTGEYEEYERAGLIKNKENCPAVEGNDPWGMGPKGVFDTDNGDKDYLLHVLSSRKLIKKTADFLNDQEAEIASGIDGRSTRLDASYVEVQIHGPITIERDIQRVHCNFYLLFGHPHFEKLYKFLIAKKIDILWYYQKKETAPVVLIQEGGLEPARVKSAWKAAAKEYKRAYKIARDGKWKQIKKKSSGLKVPGVANNGGVISGLWDSVAQANAADRKGLPKMDGRAWVRSYIAPR
ncbi:MAG: DUF3626 domain-containing protein [bacterium]|nr:DUF3626 domain-containing protein [bacterium]